MPSNFYARCLRFARSWARYPPQRTRCLTQSRLFPRAKVEVACQPTQAVAVVCESILEYCRETISIEHPWRDAYGSQVSSAKRHLIISMASTSDSSRSDAGPQQTP